MGCSMVLDLLLLKKVKQQKSACEAKSKYLCSINCYSSWQLNTAERNYFFSYHIALDKLVEEFLAVSECRRSRLLIMAANAGILDSQDVSGTCWGEPQKDLAVERTHNTTIRPKDTACELRRAGEKKIQNSSLFYITDGTIICTQLSTQCT